MFDRGTYTPPENPYEEMRAARSALSYDDIVGGVAEITESFAFQGVKWEGDSPDEADIFNQISADLDLDTVLRKMWRDVFCLSQTVLAMRWGWKEYQVRGKMPDKKIFEEVVDPVTGVKSVQPVMDVETGKQKFVEGQKRKKKYRIWCPIDIRTIDPMMVVPVGGTGPWGGDFLAWCSTLDEIDHWTRTNSGEVNDPLMQPRCARRLRSSTTSVWTPATCC
jgi:hypothetical protein